MEVIKENSNSKWVQMIKKLKENKICNPNKLKSINESIEKKGSIYDNDKKYLDTMYKKLIISTNNNLNTQQQNNDKNNVQNYIDIIKKLHQKEIGDFSRLESINNYLMASQPIIAEDEEYLHEKLKQLAKIEHKTWPDSSKPQTILIDDYEIRPTQNFVSLSKTIGNIIRNSHPHFTIGIYGEWGTGKTTLMKSVENNLMFDSLGEKEDKILPIWFNAWKYEREDNPASISLLKTVAFAMAKHDKFAQMSKTISKGLRIFSKDLMEKLSLEIISKKDLVLDEDLDEKLEALNSLYKDSIYFDGIEKIKQQMEHLRKVEGEDYRVVIFIDDIDRCSPTKALEVLESIKLFLDIKGFVFILGLSHKTVTQLITQAYKTTGVRGEDYIKKIIQIPIKIPNWSKEDIIDLLETKIAENLNEDYLAFLRKNSSIVAEVVKSNPRQLKRFINNVIIAFETFACNNNADDIKLNQIFLGQILKTEWPEFYAEYMADNIFRKITNWMTTMPRDLKKYFKYLENPVHEDLADQKNERLALLNKISEISEGRIKPEQIEILSEFDYSTWSFLSSVKETLEGIKNWKVLDSVIDVVEGLPYELETGSNESKN